MKEIILEAGTSWHSMEEAKKHIDFARRVGANFVKFLLYDKKVIETVSNRWKNHLKKVRLTESQAKELRR